MDIKFEPPALSGSTTEKLAAFEKWLAQFCEKLNVAFEMLEVSKK